MSVIRSIISLLKPFVESRRPIAEAYRAYRDQAALMRMPIESPWGFRLAGNKAMARGEFEPVETEYVRALLPDIDVLVNIGANVGYYCCHALSMGKQVIAFEPVQRNLRFLCHNIKINGWNNVEIFPLALSSKTDVLEIYGADTGASLVKGWAGISEKHVTLVPTSTLDLVMGGRLSGQRVFVLMDVEGAELSILEGATTLLHQYPRPVWMIEISSFEHQPHGVSVNPNFVRTFQILWEAGYTAFTVDHEMRQVSVVDVEAVQAGDLQRFATHNFLFK